MSIEYLNKSLKINGLTPTAKLVLVILANYADEKGSCYPSHKHIANMIGLKSKKSVQNYIKEFEKKNLLIIEHRRLDNGGYTSNRYTLTLDTTELHPMETSDTRVGLESSTNTKDKTKLNTDSDSFKEFWKIYPRRIGRKTASKSFHKFDEKHYAKIIYSVHLFARDNIATEERFIPHPTTWLNQERWLDYFELDEVGNVIRPKENKSTNKNNLAG